MPTEPAIELVHSARRECHTHRQAHHLPPARLGECNVESCPLYAGCPVLARLGADWATMIEKELQAIEVLRRALRERTMIYDADRKDLVAAHYHLAPQALYRLPYADWAALRERYYAEIESEEATDA